VAEDAGLTVKNARPAHASTLRLAVVYGLKTADYGWLNQFYPANRIARACAERGLEPRFLFPRDVETYLSGDEYRRDGERTVFLLRGEVADTVRLPLERTGRPCLNPRNAALLAQDKLACAATLSRAGWQTPKTVEIPEIPPGTNDATLPLPIPFVIKPRAGSRGKGVALIETEEKFRQWAQTRREDSIDEERVRHKADNAAISAAKPPNAAEPIFRARTAWIAQEFISPSRGRDLRAFFAGGAVIAVVERRAKDGEFRSNACVGATTRVPAWAEDERARAGFDAAALAIARTVGLWYGTVDFLFARENIADSAVPRIEDLAICEINASPGFEELEKSCGIDIAGKLVEALARDYGAPRDSDAAGDFIAPRAMGATRD